MSILADKINDIIYDLETRWRKANTSNTLAKLDMIASMLKIFNDLNMMCKSESNQIIDRIQEFRRKIHKGERFD